ncbi:MAG TPA: GrpB family protein [Hyphomonadaceae bacterium]
MADPFGLDRRVVELVPHDPDWAVRAAAESARLAEAIGETLVRIEHVGSTSIPGIVAKPTIDLMPIVQRLDELDARRLQVEALGYVWRGEFGISGRRYCVREEQRKRLFHVHCHQEGHPEIARTLVFRDYLRAHAEEARDYEALKRVAAAKHPSDTLAYSNAKSAWIRACIERAAEWAKAC